MTLFIKENAGNIVAAAVIATAIFMVIGIALMAVTLGIN